MVGKTQEYRREVEHQRRRRQESQQPAVAPQPEGARAAGIFQRRQQEQKREQKPSHRHAVPQLLQREDGILQPVPEPRRDEQHRAERFHNAALFGDVGQHEQQVNAEAGRQRAQQQIFLFAADHRKDRRNGQQAGSDKQRHFLFSLPSVILMTAL